MEWVSDMGDKKSKVFKKMIEMVAGFIAAPHPLTYPTPAVCQLTEALVPGIEDGNIEDK